MLETRAESSITLSQIEALFDKTPNPSAVTIIGENPAPILLNVLLETIQFEVAWIFIPLGLSGVVMFSWSIVLFTIFTLVQVDVALRGDTKIAAPGPPSK